MPEISSSIWTQDKNGDWKLYFNTDIDSSPQSIKIEEKKTKKDINVSDKNLIIGNLVMTPEGIGRLIKISEGIAHVRFNQEIKENQFPKEEISNIFICYITNILNGNFDITRLKLNISGKVENIFEELVKLNKINLNNNNYSLICNKNILKNDATFEQLKLKNNSKMIIIETPEKESKISRFKTIHRFWPSLVQDGICFSASGNIKLIGISLFCPHDHKAMNGVITICEGNSSSGKTLHEENVEIQPSSNKLNPSVKIKFSNSVFCKKNLDYGIILTSRDRLNCYYGNRGKANIEGDKGIVFTFKTLKGLEIYGGSNYETGNFPELYYCVK